MKTHPSRMGVGASSILLILVVVSLTLLASLALIQARADAALTQKTAVGIAAFYDADARAQAMLAALDDTIALGQPPDIVEGVVKQAEGRYAFSVGSSDSHALFIEVDVLGGSCNILSYRYESTEEWVAQSEGTLWQGG
ncbi:MAG: hypothetical protein Q8S22_10580 [Eubacteriales bacterium]|jgi:hypothetical protein|nr:hypothetical protein [Eubacteriales bacterium]